MRARFVRWRTTIRMGTTVLKSAKLQVDSPNGVGLSRHNSIPQNAQAPMIDEADTIRVRKKQIKKTASVTAEANGARTMATPSAVATPLPPRKPIQQGNM